MSFPVLADLPEGTDEAAWLAACNAVRGYCEWHIAPSVTETLTLDGPGGSVLHLPSARVTDVASVTNDGAVIADPQWSAAGMIRAGNGRWTERFRGVVVELTHGYEECPADVLKVLRDLIDGAGRTGVAQVTSGSHSVRYGPALDSEQRATLDRYRLAPLP